jgi:glutathione S-transferase
MATPEAKDTPMLLIGMLDSPYVRRVAISFQLLGLPFEHRALSVFRTFDEFRAINPVVKAPTLACDDGTVLMDSTLILQYAETLARPRTLVPDSPAHLAAALRDIGLALAACEKAVQLYYEDTLRPPEKRHAPWVTRVTGQLYDAFDALEASAARRAFDAKRMDQASVTAAVAWTFTQETIPGVVAPERCPALAAFTALAEAHPAFLAAPHGLGTVAR